LTAWASREERREEREEKRERKRKKDHTCSASSLPRTELCPPCRRVRAHEDKIP
jgi:hypothetical protein